MLRLIAKLIIYLQIVTKLVWIRREYHDGHFYLEIFSLFTYSLI